MSHCYFASFFYSIADVFYIINFYVFYISFYVPCAFIIRLIKYLLAYLLDNDNDSYGNAAVEFCHYYAYYSVSQKSSHL